MRRRRPAERSRVAGRTGLSGLWDGAEHRTAGSTAARREEAGAGQRGGGRGSREPRNRILGVPTDDRGRTRAQAGPGRAERVATLGDWAELLRLPAVLTVPGDALAGAAVVAGRPNSRTMLAVGCSLCLYEAAMALNGWADRVEDAVERPHRPIPSGRIRPDDALVAACALTVAGLALAWRAGRPAFALATSLAVTVWAYDLVLKDGVLGPVATAAARSLDLLMGAAATGGRIRPAAAPAVLLGSHTLAVAALSREETRGGSALPASAALGTAAMLTGLLSRRPASPRRPAAEAETGSGAFTGATATAGWLTGSPHGAVRAAFAAAYAAAAARPYAHAALNPSSSLIQRAVGRGIHATIPLQAALAARSGAVTTGLLTAFLAPVAARYMRKVSVT
ncbi:SCO3242 family prenyltransferase [Streptomyces sp. NPDC086787]|uniref:SCO3242 family prenyltransferase n=1 Tax=Streptomyces sp. NPDC086787 TaxID=3365759 RepID=UPI00380C4D29